jgi:hypothetical protein
VTKIVRFIKNDLLNSVVYSEGEVAGFDDWIADNLIKREFAVLVGDGRPKQVGRKVPDLNGYVSGWGTDQLAKQG